jgi:8-oxo-dGTP diphosphatase
VSANSFRNPQLSDSTTLRACFVTQTGGGTACTDDHLALRWVGAAVLNALDWVLTDRFWLPELTHALRSGRSP